MALKWTFLQATIRCKHNPTLTSSSWRPRRLPSFKSFSRLQGRILEREQRQREAQAYQDAFDHQMRQEKKRRRQQEECHHQDEECEARRGEEVRHVDKANEALHNLNYNLQERNRRAREERQEEAHVEERHELRCMANAPHIARQAYHWQAGRQSTSSMPSATLTSQQSWWRRALRQTQFTMPKFSCGTDHEEYPSWAIKEDIFWVHNFDEA